MSHEPRWPREAPVMLDELSAALDDSSLGGTLGRVWRAVIVGVGESRGARIVRQIAGALVDEESKLLASGIVLVVAMAVHLLLLAVAQPYAFPGYSTYWLPVALLVTGVLLIAMRGPIAAARRDRALRGR